MFTKSAAYPVYSITKLILIFILLQLVIYPQNKSTWVLKTPVIDGEIEWGSADKNKINLASGWLLAQNDSKYLYLLLDLPMDSFADQALSSAPWGDCFSITFDVNNDRQITPNVDVNYGFYPGQYKLGFQYYLGPSTWTGLNNSEAKLGVGFKESFNYSIPHRIWEIAIPLQEIQKKPGEMIRLGVDTYSQNPSFRYLHPANYFNDFSNLIEINLGSGLYMMETKSPESIEDKDQKAIKRTILENGNVELRFPDGTIKRFSEGGCEIIRPGENPLIIRYTQVQNDNPPEMPSFAVNQWMEGFGNDLLETIKSMVTDGKSMNYYLQRENEKQRNIYEKMRCRLDCIRKLISN